MGAEILGRLDSAAEYFQQARQSSQTGWQSFYAQRHLARIAILNRDPTALEKTSKAIELAEIERLDDVLTVAREVDHTEAVRLIESYHRTLEPVTSLTSNQSLERAPLLNGDFELGLTACWGDTLDKLDVPAWQRFGGSLATAAVVEGVAHTGKQSLHIRDLQEPVEGAHAELSQRVPVEEGKRYRCTLWIRSEVCLEGSLSLLANQTEFITARPGAYDWQRLEGEFQTESTDLTLRIRCQGKTDV